MRPGRLLLALLAGFCLAGAAQAAQGGAGQPPHDPLADIAAETANYGTWLGRMLEIEAPVDAQLANLDPQWRAAIAQGGTGPEVAARLRPIIARALAEIDAANRRIDALERPQFTRLALEADLEPAAMAREIRTLNEHIREAFAGFNPMIDAIASNDRAAVEAAGTRILASFALVLETKVLLSRASVAATPRDDPAWAISNIDLIVDRVSARMFGAWRPFAPPRVDPSLPQDLDAFAHELDSTAEQGERVLDAALDRYRSDLAGAERGGEQNAVPIFRRVIDTLSLGRDYFPIARELAALLRAEAGRSRDHAVTQERMMAFFGQLRPMRERLEEVGVRMVGAMGQRQ